MYRLGIFGAVVLLGLTLMCSSKLAQVQAQAQAAGSDAQVMNLMRSGQEALRRGDLPAAEAEFRRAVEAAPTLSDTYLGLGLVELRRGELDDAAKSLGKASELNPQLPGAHLFLGIAQYQGGQGESAAASLRAELALTPDNIEALTWLGIVALGTDHPEQAVQPLDRAAILRPNDAQVLYYQAKAHELVAKAALAKLYKLDPDSVLVHRALAETLAESGQPEKSIAEYEAALRKQPGDPDLLEGLGEQEQKLGRFDDAAKLYEQELTRNPGSAIALYNLGKIDVEHGKPAEGVDLMRKAQNAHALPAPTDFYLGYGLAQLGQNEEAAHWLEQALAGQPSPFIEQSALFQVARVYQHLSRKEDAQRALERLRVLKAQSSPQNTATGALSSAGSTVTAPTSGQP